MYGEPRGMAPGLAHPCGLTVVEMAAGAEAVTAHSSGRMWRRPERTASRLSPEEQRAESDEGGDPEAEHPAHEAGLESPEPIPELRFELRSEFGQPLLELRVELGPASAPLGIKLHQPLLQLRVELGPASAPLGVKLHQPLLELRVEAREVQLVQLAQVSAVGRVHGVKPVHEFVRDILAQLVVQLPRQFRRDRQMGLL